MTGNSLRVHCIPIGLLFLICFRHVKMWSLPSPLLRTPGAAVTLGRGSGVMRCSVLQLHSRFCTLRRVWRQIYRRFISKTKLEVSSDLLQTPVICPMGEWHCRCMRLKRRRSWWFYQLHLKSLLEEKNLFCVYYSTTLRCQFFSKILKENMILSYLAQCLFNASLGSSGDEFSNRRFTKKSLPYWTKT